jgi:hypothetical protein
MLSCPYKRDVFAAAIFSAGVGTPLPFVGRLSLSV